MRSPSSLTEKDLDGFRRIGVFPKLLDRAGVDRVTDAQARTVYGINGTGDHSGIVFPYRDPLTGVRHTCRLRRDHPEIESGAVKGKYRCQFGDRRHLYFVHGCADLINDATVPVVLVEAEKSALALTAWAERNSYPLLPIAMGGCWGWRERVSKQDGPDGERVDEKGPLPELRVCSNRAVFVMLDSNVSKNADVRRAEHNLMAELLAMGAVVKTVRLPESDSVNGPDDQIAASGDQSIHSLFASAKLAQEIAIADAEAAIAAIDRKHPDAEKMRCALDAIAAVTDNLQRQLLEAKLAAAVRGSINKATVAREVKERRDRQEAHASQAKRRIEEDELRKRPLDSARLIDDLEKFFAHRAYLAEGAALLLAYFVLNSYLFDIFDTTPYTNLESATPGCGKSTVVALIESVGYQARNAASLSEAALFRVIDSEKPLLIIEEAAVLQGNSERGNLLRPILHEGYKRGARAARCEGEDNAVRWFDIFCPKVISEIGGLTGALLDRSIVIHMDRAPKADRARRKSSRIRPRKRDAAALVEKLQLYAIQAGPKLSQLYDDEPDAGYWPELEDRESELFSPLLIHAKFIGAEAEARLITVVQKFTRAKADIKETDLATAKALALLDVVEEMSGETVTPGDLVDSLAEYEVWAVAFGSVKGDEKTKHKGMAAKIGYFLRSFRLQSHGRRVKAYDRQAVINALRAHVPENHRNHRNPHDADHHAAQGVNNTQASDGRDSCDSSAHSGRDANSEQPNHRTDDPGLDFPEETL